MRLVVCAGYMHLLTPALPRSLPRPDRQRPSVAAAGVPGRPRDRRRARRRGRDDRRHRPPRRRGPRHRPGDPPGARPRPAARDADPAHPRGRAPAAARGGERAVRALISVFDKTGLDTLAKGLASLGWELVASGGTADSIRELGLDVTRVEDLTEFPEMLGGRVKTLHPRIHAGILARREVETDLAALAEHGIELFDLVCVNLYPFEQVAREHGVREEEAVEMIDIGGPSMLRGAAKNFAHVAPVCRPDDYEPVLDRAARVRRALARDAQATRGDGVRDVGEPTRRRSRPGSPAASRSRRSSRRCSRSTSTSPTARTRIRARPTTPSAASARTCWPASSSCTGASSRSTTSTTSTRRGCSCASSRCPACVIVKHANPCGVAVGASIEEAYEVALAADPLSAYGGVVVLNRAVSAALGERLAEQFVEVLFAPGYDEVALEALVQKQSIRILNDTERRQAGGVGARLQARPRRPARAGPRLGRRGPRGDGDRDGRADGGAVGRSALRRPRLQARRLERDRDREGPADDRDRRGPDEPRRLRPDRDREGARARPLARRAPRSPRMRSSPSPTVRGSRSTRASTPSSSPAARSATST